MVKLPDTLPKSINICGSIYKIKYTTRLDKVDIVGRDMLWGQIDFQSHTIRVYAGKDRPLQAIWKTLLHEIMHGVFLEYNVQSMIGVRSLDELEMINDTLSSGLYDTLVRNNLLTIE